MTNQNSREVAAAEFSPPGQTAGPPKSRKTLSRIALIAAVALVVAGTVQTFVVLERNSASAPAPVVVQAEPYSPVEEQPFRDAALLQARTESQALLAPLLGMMVELEKMGAGIWAADDFAEMMQLGEAGDANYQQRLFEASLQSYELALDLANKIEAMAPIALERLVAEGATHLDNLEAEAATEVFELAEQIDAADDRVQTGLRRASQLDQVSALTLQATQLLETGDPDAALVAVREALSLDAQFESALVLRTQIEQTILDRDFDAAMSRGYSALAANNLSAARAGFNEAERLKPDHPLLADARNILASAGQAGSLGALRNSAENAASLEQWESSRDLWAQILELEPAAVEARVQLIRSQARMDLDQRIQAVLADPLRLRDDSEWQSAETILREARAIRDPGSRLLRQITDLSSAISRARTPVRLELRSDGETRISVLGVGDIGTFQTYPLDLYPGRYVILGRRSGYQDVRHEIMINGDTLRIDLEVVSTQSIDAL